MKKQILGIFLVLMPIIGVAQQNRFNCNLTINNGAAMTIVFIDDETDLAFLAGLGVKDNIIWKVQLPTEEVNAAKCRVQCKENQIEIEWGMPFSAATVTYHLTWDGQAVQLAETKQEDLSAGDLDNAIDQVLTGKGVNWDLDVMYPDRYIQPWLIEETLKKGHQKALTLYKQKKLTKATQLLTDVFDFSVLLNSFIGFCDGCSDKVQKSSGIETKLPVWQQVMLEMEVGPSVYIPALNDLGYFLQKKRDHQAAIRIFAAVLKKDGNRVAARLNIADSYWALGKRHHAINHYLMYQKARKKQNKSVPKRVMTRTEGAALVGQ